MIWVARFGGVRGKKGGYILSTYPDAKRSAVKIAQQEAPDAAVISKQETGEVGQAMAGRFLWDSPPPKPKYTKI